MPDYTRTCTCAYQNQTSLALIHMPEAEMWTSFGTKEIKGAITRLGINFGAPGDHKAADGTLWLEYPSVAGISPAVEVTTRPDKLETFHGMAHMRTHKLTEDIWLAAARSARARAPHQFEFQKRFAFTSRSRKTWMRAGDVSTCSSRGRRSARIWILLRRLAARFAAW